MRTRLRLRPRSDDRPLPPFAELGLKPRATRRANFRQVERVDPPRRPSSTRLDHTCHAAAHFGALIAALTDAAKATRDLVGSSQLKGAIVQLKETATSMKVAMASLTKTSDRLNSHIDPIMESLKKTSDQARLTLASAQATLNDLNGTFDADSPVGYQLIHALQNMSDASQAVTALADYLHRNPSALVRGKASTVATAP